MAVLYSVQRLLQRFHSSDARECVDPDACDLSQRNQLLYVCGWIPVHMRNNSP